MPIYGGTGTGGSRQATHDSFLNDWNTRMERMERIAFLGLGIMGNRMAKRLLAAGYPLTVWNRTASRAEPLQAEGADVAASPAEAVREARLWKFQQPRRLDWPVIPMINLAAHVYDSWLARGTATKGHHGGLR